MEENEGGLTAVVLTMEVFWQVALCNWVYIPTF
jgi:hypothetical protein